MRFSGETGIEISLSHDALIDDAVRKLGILLNEHGNELNTQESLSRLGPSVAKSVNYFKTERFCRKTLEWRKPLFMFESKEHEELLAAGAKVMSVEGFIEQRKPDG